MSVNEELVASCQFAYEQLRRPDCPIPAPAEMLAFLHHPRLSARALSVAHRAIEGNDDLRRYLADTSNVALVGEQGWAWLNDADELSARVIDLRTNLAKRDQELARLRAEVEALRHELAAALEAR